MATNKQTNTGVLATAKTASTICLLAGIWLFISPWIYDVYMIGNSWNCWIVGGFMILFGIIRIVRPAYSTVLSWINMILGIWTFASPWIYSYTTDRGRFINSLCVGVIVFIFSIISAKTSWNRVPVPLKTPYAPGADDTTTRNR